MLYRSTMGTPGAVRETTPSKVEIQSPTSVQETTPSGVEIPRTMSDQGKYYLLEQKQSDGVITALHMRIGVNETGYSNTEINCVTGQYREIGYGENGLNHIATVQGRWTESLKGSSKADLVSFVCSHP